MVDPEAFEQLGKYCAVLLVLIMLIVGVMKVSLYFFPPSPEKMDPEWTSRSLTGWTNTPAKLAKVRTIEKIAENE